MCGIVMSDQDEIASLNHCIIANVWSVFIEKLH